ncbi:MAG: hypothetical protein CMJ49_10140 [Planctomycetaceae bacterium]|nr:hypothetical protein [Planctomycetaceae bacterium]
MRVMYLMSRLPWPPHGGQEVHAHHVMRAMVDRGHELRLMLLEGPELGWWQSWPLQDRVKFECVGGNGEKADAAAGERGSIREYVRGRWARY